MAGKTNLPWLQGKGVLGKTDWKRAPQLQTRAGTVSTQYHTSLLDAFYRVGSAPSAPSLHCERQPLGCPRERIWVFPVPVSMLAQEPSSCPRARLALSKVFADSVSGGAAVLQALLLSLQEHQAQVGSTLAAVLAAGRFLALTVQLRTILDASVSEGTGMEHFLGLLQGPIGL